MAKFLVVLALSILTAQSAVLRNTDASLKRAVRSPCDSCEHEHHHALPPFPPPPPGPPPPPPGFHAQQWTGLIRSADGSHQGVFSGAAASAQGDTQASGQAFSSSSADSGPPAQDLSYHSGTTKNQAEAARSASNAGASWNHGNQAGANSFGAEQSSSFGSQANAGASSYGKSSGGYGGQGQGGDGQGPSEHFENGGDASGQASGPESQALAGENSFGQGSNRGQGQSGGYGQPGRYENRGDVSGSGQASRQESKALAGANSYGQGGDGSNSGYSGQSGYNGGSHHESGQATLQGALGLASQGLQTQGAGGGCSTCGKKSYALSNAKSHSGNAVAVSVNG